MKILVQIFILLLHNVYADSDAACFFPESEVRPFFYEVSSDIPTGSSIADSLVDPPGASLSLASVRSGNLPNTNFTDRFSIEVSKSGRFTLRNVKPLNLPAYPSQIEETFLYVTTICNNQAYPLITVRISGSNAMSPQFFNQPYQIVLPKDVNSGTLIDTSILAVDWDPATEYGVKYLFEDPSAPFEIVTTPGVRGQPLPIDGAATWDDEHLPSRVQLRLTQPIQRLPLSLKLVATDSGVPPKQSVATVKILAVADPKGKTTHAKVHASKLVELPPIRFPERKSSFHEEQQRIDKQQEKNRPEFHEDNNVEPTATLERFNPSPSVSSNSAESKKSSEQSQEILEDPARFQKCYVDVRIPENSPEGTLVTTLNVVNKKKGTRLRLIDNDGTFTLDERNGEVRVKNVRLIDRELFSTVEFVAEVKGVSRTTECGRVRVKVQLIDENDNRPVFEKEKYWFHLSEDFPPGREIGKLRARDIDDDENGQVTYHLVNDSRTVPFQVGTKGRDAILISTGPIGDKDVHYLLIEAKDHGYPAKTAQISVEIFVLRSAARRITPPKAEGIVIATVPVVDITNAPVVHETTTTRRQRPQLIVTSEESEEEEEVVEEETTTRSSRRRTTTTTTTTEVPIREREEEERRIITTVQTPESRRTTTTEDPREQERRIDVPPPHIPHNRKQFIDEPHPTLTNVEFFRDKSIPSSRPVQSAQQNNVNENESKEEFFEEEIPFAFTQDSYYFEVFGDPVEDEIFGRVVAQPDTQMYGIDKKVAGIFKVDPDIGELAVGRRLYNQESGNITFTVSATNGISTAKAVVTVLFSPESNRTQSVPQFDQRVYKFRIQENDEPQVIGIVRAFHVMLSSRDSLLHYAIDTSESIPFEVHTASGEITNTKSLDHEEHANYEFRIRACLVSSPFCGIATVLVTVEDVNDNSPQFPSSLFHITLPSDLPIGSDVAKLRATDADSGPNAVISYVLTPPSSVFAIDFDTGSLLTVASLTESHYTLLAEAFDHGIPRRTDVIEIRIMVQGTNPSVPVFDKKQYESVLTSPVRAGSVVAELHAVDPDPGRDGQVVYRFEAATDERTKAQQAKFQINDQSGVITALKTMTASDGPFDLIVEAIDESTVFKRKSSVPLHVEILGDSSIRFLPLPINVFISTEKAVGSVILRASAFTTSSEPVRFRVLEDSSQFTMDGDYLRVANHLVPGEAFLTIRAETESHHVDHRLRVIVMADRDKYPVFPHLTYDLDISSESNFPIVVNRFGAQLQNGSIRYSFFPKGNAPKGLLLDEITGELTATADYPRNPLTRDTVFIVVRATNINFPNFFSDVGVSIVLISARPAIRFPHPIYRIDVKENTPIGTILEQPQSIEVFPKSSSIRYSLVPNSVLGIFTNGSIFVKETLDLESLSVDRDGNLNFVISADSGTSRATAKLMVRIMDENEFSPQFIRREFEGRIREDAAPGTVVAKVTANDGDFTEGEHLLYKIVGGVGRNLVFVQEDGTIILGEEALDHDKLHSFDVIVEAIDRGGNSARTRVLITVDDVNDNAPVIVNQPLVWKISEDSSTATYVVHAEDRDTGSNSEVHFRILKGNEQNHFDLTEGSGNGNEAEIRLVHPLDREEQSTYSLVIEAKDDGNPPKVSTATLTVNVLDVNDNVPQIKEESYKQETPIDLPIGFPILTVTASDKDGDRLSFDISGPSECTSQISIDPLGVVSYSKPTSKRQAGELRCSVKVSDGIHTATVPLTLILFSNTQPTIPTVSNRSPQFSRQTYSMNLTSQHKERRLLTVKASDPDGDIVYFSIEPPEYRNLFDVDEKGNVLLKIPISQLEQSLYSFLVVAEDQGHPIMSSFTNIKIHMPENIKAVASSTPRRVRPTIIPGSRRESTVSLTTRTNESPASAVSSEPNEANPTVVTGTTISEEIDEKPDVGRTPTPTAPRSSMVTFSRTRYMYSIRTEAEIGTYLGEVQTNSPQPVRLAFEKTDKFTIDEQGRIRTAEVFMRADKVEDKIIAYINDMNVAEVPFVVHIVPTAPTTAASVEELPTRSSHTIRPTTSQRRTPTESIDETSTWPTEPTKASSPPANGFAFRRNIYFAFMPEGKYSNGAKLSFKPEPLSVTSSEKVIYSIDESELNLPFFLMEDGQLVIFDVDRELRDSYMFKITARPSSNPSTIATATVNVTILDVNDNYPKFESFPSSIGLSKDIPIGTVVHQFHAVDPDSGEYGSVTYEIVDESRNFMIDAYDGTLSTNGSLANSSEDIIITVSARDNGRPALKTERQLSIRLFASSESVPRLPKEMPEMFIPDGEQAEAEITQLVAGPNTAVGTTNTDKIHYAAVDNNSELFSVSDDGKVFLSRIPTDPEKAKYHQLNVTATNEYGIDWILLSIFVDGAAVATTPQPSTNRCTFPNRIQNVDIPENQEERTRLVKVTSSCEAEGTPYVYSLAHNSEDFELHPHTGELFAIRPLDRERRTLHFIYINVTDTMKSRAKRQVNPAIELAMSRLTMSQTLVVVRVIDINDNPPQFIHMTTIKGMTANIDWQAPPLTSVLRLEASDLDERQTIAYSIKGGDSETFMINATSGIISTRKSIQKDEKEKYEMIGRATDGIHFTEIPVTIFKLNPDTNIVQLTSEMPHSQVDEQKLEAEMSHMTNSEARVLVKQPFVDNAGHADPSRSHIFVYAVNRTTMEPIPRDQLKELLSAHSAALLSSSPRISSIGVLSPSSSQNLSATHVLLAFLIVIAIAFLLFCCCMIASWFKRKQLGSTTDRDYMVGSIGAGPRPYDVEIVSRQTAQAVLAQRPLPEPMEHQIEVAVSPAFMDTVSTNRSDTTKDFANSVRSRERPSLLQSALARHKVHQADTGLSANVELVKSDH